MKNICKIKRAVLGSLFVIPTTSVVGYLIYLSIITEVCWWPLYNEAPIMIHVFSYATVAFLTLMTVLFIIYWLSLIMKMGGWIKSKLEGQVY